MVLDEVAGERGHVLGGGALMRVGQAVGIGEARGRREPELVRLRVHPGHELLLGPAQVLGHRRGGVVGRRDRDALEERPERQGSPVLSPMRYRGVAATRAETGTRSSHWARPASKSSKAR